MSGQKRGQRFDPRVFASFSYDISCEYAANVQKSHIIHYVIIVYIVSGISHALFPSNHAHEASCRCRRLHQTRQ